MFIQLLVLALLVLCFYNCYWKRRGLPDGPMPLPFFGNLLQIGLQPPGTEFLKECRNRYGSVFTYWLGEIPFVAFADYDTIVETMVNDCNTYTDREFFGDFYTAARGNSDGIFNLNGQDWKEHHRFIQRSMRSAGIGSIEFEEKLAVELEALFEEINQDISKNNGYVQDLQRNVDVFIGSSLNLWLFGYTFSGVKTQEFADIKRCVVEFMQYTGKTLPMLAMCNPQLLKRTPLFNPIIQTIRQKIYTIHSYFNKQIMELHYEEFSDHSFVKSFLKEIKLKESNSRFELQVLYGMLRDLWIAGQDTVTNSFEWALIFMIHNPDKQAKLQEELNKVIGTTEVITSKHRNDLPYCCATVNEIQRLSNLLPFNIPRKTTRPTTVNGHKLKTGTAVNALISLVQYDEKIFPNPNSFIPERFLNEDGQFQKIDGYFPFGCGKRSCPGENLAKTELFLLISNFLNRYEIASNGPLPSLKRNFGLNVKPEKFQCRLKSRY